MDMQLKDKFTKLWKKYFGKSELPITFYYTDQEGCGEFVKAPAGQQCFIGALAKVRKGVSLSFNESSIGCGGGKKYLGYSQNLRPNFEYFLSCGVPGEMEGERYKKTPEMVLEILKKLPQFKAPGKYLVFKRWDKLESGDEPQVVIFFAEPDVLSGLFTLSNFDEIEPNGVFCPFGAGCGTIIMYPYLELTASRPKAVLGMFDVSARPFVQKDVLSFAVPMNKFTRMVANMEESFLITDSWAKVKGRIEK